VAVKCDRNDFLKKVESENPSYYTQQKNCMQSWAGILGILQMGEEAKPERLMDIRNELIEWLEMNGVDGEEYLTQVQYYLGVVQSKSHRMNAEEEYANIKARVPALPPIEGLLPQRQGPWDLQFDHNVLTSKEALA
jgi:hypothetical protein